MANINKILGIVAVILTLLFVVSCTSQTIEDIKNEDHVGKTVAVRGTVENTIKIGQLSGYTLSDNSGETIGVSTEDLPQEGDIVTAKGVLMKDTLFGYYILNNN
ncbi:MAG: hypothetical protein ABIG93_02270 [archaeon]|nr:hypothetical protein [Nanoarchaeota archaeon]